MSIKLALSFVIGLAATGAFAQSVTDIQANTGKSAYLQDGRNVIVRTPYGLCWRTGDWTPADAVPGCDGQLAPPVAKITAPPVPVPASPPAPSAPTAPPVTVVQTPQPCDFTVTLENDQTFPFNMATLSDAARRAIDQRVAAKLASCARINAVVVTGHADHIGTQRYNQKLSERRAKAVATYLKSKANELDIEVIGAGESQPVKTCDNNLDRRQLIECLAPNRRVKIEVKGTQSQR